MARNEALFQAVYTGDRDAAREAVQAALDNGESVESIMNDSLIAAMRHIGSYFECGEAFISEMLIAARAMDTALQVIEPLLVKSGVEPKGRVCIGTVQGDLHDIGKNLVAMMLKGAGYQVDDLGVDCSLETYVSAVERGAQVVCLSALLTTTMPAMQDVVAQLKQAGFDVPVIVGGAPITQEYADQIGASGFSSTASGAVSVVERCLS
ncbi:MAG: corrinoid protein [Planctomycetales bacterium]|nr:corrinoid protein [Planctomycetales bacterium]